MALLNQGLPDRSHKQFWRVRRRWLIECRAGQTQIALSSPSCLTQVKAQ
ncbi:hypothetical protein NDI47_01075 [Microcoleus vaginatus GB1-A2]|nr:hypothetical protein [Microcoleus sp. FACHB-61]